MPIELPEFQAHTIVLIGNFNPPIVQPAWLASHNLISKAESDNAKIHLIHPQVADFSLDWARLTITTERFSAASEDEDHYILVRDLVAGIFSVLSHSPIRMMGLNHSAHYSLSTEERWNRLGDLLAPKEPWKDILKKPGMRTLNMEGQRVDEFRGRNYLKVEPSARINFGVVFDYNDHFEISDPESKTVGSDEILAILKASWEQSRARAKHIMNTILNLV